MRIPILTFGAIASIIAINSVLADTVVTSRNYVDTQDALKQDKITAGTTGSVVTYNGAQNGQTQFSERGIFDPETDWDDENGEIVSGHEGDLLDAGSIFPDLAKMDLMIKGMGNALRGTAGNVITYNENGYAGGERGICEDSTDNCNQADIATFGLVGDVATNINNNMETNINNAVDYLINVNNNNNDITNMANTLTSQSLTPVWVQSPLACAKMENNDCVLWSIGGSAIVHKLDDCKTDQDCPNCDSGFMKRCDDGLCKCIYGACSTASDCNCASGMIASCANNVCACNQCNTASDCSCGSGMTASCVNNTCRCDVCKVDGTLVSNGSQCCSGRNDYHTHICCGTPGSGFYCSEK